MLRFGCTSTGAVSGGRAQGRNAQVGRWRGGLVPAMASLGLGSGALSAGGGSAAGTSRGMTNTKACCRPLRQCEVATHEVPRGPLPARTLQGRRFFLAPRGPPRAPGVKPAA